VQARHGVDRAGYVRHLEAVLETRPHLLLDDGCDLLDLLHTRRTDLLEGVRAGCEETTTGVLRLRQMAADGALRLPVVAVNDTPSQLLVANRHGTGQSTVDALLRSTGLLLAGATVVVAGYGWCGAGVATRLRGLGARVLVTEVDPLRALEAVLDGHQVLPMLEAAPLADVVVTATGNRDVLTDDAVALLRDGAVLANAGHFDVEIDVEALARAAVTVHRGSAAARRRLRAARRTPAAAAGRGPAGQPRRGRGSPLRRHGRVVRRPGADPGAPGPHAAGGRGARGAGPARRRGGPHRARGPRRAARRAHRGAGAVPVDLAAVRPEQPAVESPTITVRAVPAGRVPPAP
jgi:hypothetical protein